MTAEEMFKDLEYKKINPDELIGLFKDILIFYEYSTNGSYSSIKFFKNKTIGKNGYEWGSPFSMEELKAINKQCEELDWI